MVLKWSTERVNITNCLLIWILHSFVWDIYELFKQKTCRVAIFRNLNNCYIDKTTYRNRAAGVLEEKEMPIYICVFARSNFFIWYVVCIYVPCQVFIFGFYSSDYRSRFGFLGYTLLQLFYSVIYSFEKNLRSERSEHTNIFKSPFLTLHVTYCQNGVYVFELKTSLDIAIMLNRKQTSHILKLILL